MQINWLKHLSFFVFYCFMVAVVFIWFIKPQLSDFKKTYTHYHKELSILNQLQQNTNTLTNHQTITTELKKILDTFFESYNIESKEILQTKNYSKQSHTITAQTRNIKAFEELLAFIKVSSLSMQLDLPINIKQEKDKIIITFKLNTYFLS